ncbi:MAG: hypothetical protein HKN87_03130, partial [Saprospiraceae bacterium]|nr:hypothetical protein [Saprospiraceae bacterium]
MVYKGFREVIFLLLRFILLGVILENLYELVAAPDRANWLSMSLLCLLFGVVFIFSRKQIRRYIATPYFAITSLVTVALATAIGTFIVQNSSPNVYEELYGQQAYKLIKLLVLHDVFHAWWYVILFVLLIVSLLKISLVRPLNYDNLGFHLSHLGPIIIIIGFWTDYYVGYRGLIQLLKGMESSKVWVYQRNTNKVVDSMDLDFVIRLNNFETEKYNPDHRLQLGEVTMGEVDLAAINSENARIISTFPLEIDKNRRIYNYDITFKLKEFYPNFYLEYSYPQDKDDVEPTNPGVLLEISTPHGNNLVKLPQDGSGEPVLY